MFKVGDSSRSFDETGPATGAPDLSIAIQADLNWHTIVSMFGQRWALRTQRNGLEISDDAKNVAIVPDFGSGWVMSIF